MPPAFYLYWACNALSVAFGFGVIHEVFVDVFRSFHTLRDLGTVLFKWAGLVMLLVAGVVSVSTNSSTCRPGCRPSSRRRRCVRIIQVGMVLFLLFFAHYVGVSRRQHSFGIALGFGSFAVVELVADLFLGRKSFGQALDEHRQHGRLQLQSDGVAGLCRGEESGSRCLAFRCFSRSAGSRACPIFTIRCRRIR